MIRDLKINELYFTTNPKKGMKRSRILFSPKKTSELCSLLVYHYALVFEKIRINCNFLYFFKIQKFSEGVYYRGGKK